MVERYAVLLNLVLVYTPVPVNTKTGVIYFILVTRIHTFCDITPPPSNNTELGLVSE
jgi:hypothetical protein